jgi:hypothetical protein
VRFFLPAPAFALLAFLSPDLDLAQCRVLQRYEQIQIIVDEGGRFVEKKNLLLQASRTIFSQRSFSSCSVFFFTRTAASASSFSRMAFLCRALIFPESRNEYEHIHGCCGASAHALNQSLRPA